MTPRSIAMPTPPATRKASGTAISQRAVEQPRRVGADRLLHDEGRVGAEHDHLAMRHVDDAHDAEGDGEADRGEQQHRAERQAVPDVLHDAATAARRSSIDGDRAVRRRALRRPAVVGRQRAQMPRARPGRRCASSDAIAARRVASATSVLTRR